VRTSASNARCSIRNASGVSSGTVMRHLMPAAAAYAAAALPALPAEGSAIAPIPQATAPLTASDRPRALKDCVGMPASSFQPQLGDIELASQRRQRQQRHPALAQPHRGKSSANGSSAR